MVLGMVDLTYAERALLAVIANHDGQGGAFPSLERLAAILGVYRRTVVNLRGSLYAKGRLRWRRTQRSNRYEVAYCDPWPKPPPKQSHRRDFPDDGNSTVGEIPTLHRRENPDGNRKEPEGAARERGRREWRAEYARADVTGDCREGSHCGLLGSDEDRCPRCGKCI